MGLVSTWLNGIGLSSAVPTFQAAGIVTPAALAELDVAHFEALGISDADDRRKLFYLVQRIKMAVNKDKTKQEDSVEEQVDAVISNSSMVEEEEEEEDFTEKKEEEKHAPSSVTSRNVIDTAPSTATSSTQNSKASTEPRRSRRLAAKHLKEPNPKENDQPQHSPAKVGRESPQRSSRKSIPTAGAKKERLEARNQKAEDQTREEVGEGGLPQDEREDNHALRPNTRSQRKKSTTRLSDSSSRAKAVFNLEDDDEPTRPASPRRKSGLQKPKYVSSTPKSSSDPDPVEDQPERPPQTPNEKSNVASTRRHESKLRNPGKSMRTGKHLSAIPSESIAPMSPLVDLPTKPREVSDEETAQTTQTSVGSGSRSRSKRAVRRNSAGSRGSDSLDALLQSSVSDVDTLDAESDSESLTQIPKLNKSRPKSMGAGEPVVNRTPSSSTRGIARPTTKRSSSNSDLGSLSTSSTQRKSEGSLRFTPRSDSLPQPAKPSGRAKPFVQGGTQTESWADKVSNLREDNDAEHELFCDQGEQQLYEFDMRIRVIVRKRPLSKAEASLSGGIDVIHPLDYGHYGRVLAYQPKTRVDLTKEIETIPFSFDNVFDESSTNNEIYQRSLRSLIQPFFRGQWSTVFAYGQTGSGKTFTMMGSNMTGINAGTARNDNANLGLYYLAALDIFEMLKKPEYRKLRVQVSLFEIYGGKLFDLLNTRRQVKCLEDSKGKVCFPGLTEHPVQGPDELIGLIEEGATNRSTGTTSRNADSSRSHAVLQLKLRKDVGRKKNIEHGRLNFIDLAGSERGADTSSSSRATRLEGAEINTSLLALKEVIRALATGGSMTHIPFRGSKLTQVLKDSFVGENSRCCMVACISPDIGNCEQTLNTLRYADRVKERDSESGALSGTYEQPVRLNPLTLASRADDDEPLDDEEGLHDLSRIASKDTDDGEESVVSISRYQSDTDTVVLEDILRTSFKEPSNPVAQPDSRVDTSNKHKAGEALVSSHRAAMSEMLEMVKNEMTLVNKVDGDRDGLDDYLAQLDVMQRTQMDLIRKLRGSLNNYVTACEAPDLMAGNLSSDDESFEDLRD